MSAPIPRTLSQAEKENFCNRLFDLAEACAKEAVKAPEIDEQAKQRQTVSEVGRAALPVANQSPQKPAPLPLSPAKPPKILKPTPTQSAPEANQEAPHSRQDILQPYLGAPALQEYLARHTFVTPHGMLPPPLWYYGMQVPTYLVHPAQLPLFSPPVQPPAAPPTQGKRPRSVPGRRPSHPVSEDARKQQSMQGRLNIEAPKAKPASCPASKKTTPPTEKIFKFTDMTNKASKPGK